MKKAITFLITMILMVSCANADGLFPGLSDYYGIELPSIESLTRSNPIYSEQLPDGKNLYIYDSINNEWMDKTGSVFWDLSNPLRWADKMFFEKEKCELKESETVDGIFIATIQKNEKQFYFFYDILTGQVACIYPEGTYPKKVPYSMDVIEMGSYGSTVDKFGCSIPDIPLKCKWFIMKKDNNTAFVLSERTFGKTAFSSERNDNWDTSEIRAWINNDLYNTLFTEQEKAAIIEKEYVSSIWDSSEATQIIETFTTTDKLVLLNREEAEALDKGARKMLVENYWIHHSKDQIYYFLRDTVSGGLVSRVTGESGYISFNYFRDEEADIRVAMWVDLDMISPIEVSSSLYDVAISYSSKLQ